mmetsp:Transcript_8320/g.13912  ORF Transcript_8320/g.13912 Transcript_8320/m.13912 type:complete len:242 (+) Transcript_8320:1471-2196(+)
MAEAEQPVDCVLRALRAREVQGRVALVVGLLDGVGELVSEVGDREVVVVEGGFVHDGDAIFIFQIGAGAQVLDQEPEHLVRILAGEVQGRPAVVRQRDLVDPGLDDLRDLLLYLLVEYALVLGDQNIGAAESELGDKAPEDVEPVEVDRLVNEGVAEAVDRVDLLANHPVVHGLQHLGELPIVPLLQGAHQHRLSHDQLLLHPEVRHHLVLLLGLEPLLLVQVLHLGLLTLDRLLLAHNLG